MLERLRQRKVLQWTLGYAAAAWIAVQVVDLVSEPWGLSTGFQRALQVVALAGVVVTLVVSWYHGEPGRQGVPTSEMVLIATLVLGTVAVAWRAARSDAVPAIDAVESLGDGPPRLAVLPFDNLTGDPSVEPFVNGLHEDLSIRLSNVDGLTLISGRSSARFGTSPEAVRDIASQLDASAVLVAAVQRSGSTVRFTAQLVDGATEENIWASRYDRQISVDNVFEVQGDLAEQVAEAVATRFTAEDRVAIRGTPTTDPEAFELYVRGRDNWIRLTSVALNRSLEYLTAATEIDPGFARAYSAMADTYLAMEFVGAMELDEAVRRARQAAERAIQVDSGSGEARTALGHVFLHELNGPAGERELREAIRLSPSFVDAYMFLSFSLLDWGRIDEGRVLADRALQIDPLSTYGAWGEGLVRLALDDYAGAAVHLQRALDLDGMWVANYELAWVYSALGDQDRALFQIREALAKADGALAREFGLRSTAAAFMAEAGQLQAARSTLTELEEADEPAFSMGVAYAVLGELDRAFDLWLNETEWTILLPAHFRYGPLLDDVRDDPRYREVVDAIQLQWGWSP